MLDDDYYVQQMGMGQMVEVVEPDTDGGIPEHFTRQRGRRDHSMGGVNSPLVRSLCHQDVASCSGASSVDAPSSSGTGSVPGSSGGSIQYLDVPGASTSTAGGVRGVAREGGQLVLEIMGYHQMLDSLMPTTSADVIVADSDTDELCIEYTYLCILVLQ